MRVKVESTMTLGQNLWPFWLKLYPGRAHFEAVSRSGWFDVGFNQSIFPHCFEESFPRIVSCRCVVIRVLEHSLDHGLSKSPVRQVLNDLNGRKQISHLQTWCKGHNTFCDWNNHGIIVAFKRFFETFLIIWIICPNANSRPKLKGESEWRIFTVVNTPCPWFPLFPRNHSSAWAGPEGDDTLMSAPD